MNKIKIGAISFLLSLSTVSCTDILNENVDPDAANKVNVEEGLPPVVFFAQQSVYDHAEYNIYLSQCLTGLGKSAITTYSYKSEWEFLTMNRHPQWRRHGFDCAKNISILIANSKTLKSPNYELIARTIQLLSTQLATDVFGDMPRSQALISLAPKYDTQASIYSWMFQEIDDLIAMYEDEAIVNSPTNLKITQRQDRVYAGDLEKWKGLVYAIKARLLLRNIPNVDRSGAMCQQIINAADAAINQWRSGNVLYGWFGNEPRYNFDGGVSEQNAPWSSSQPAINTWESRKNLLDAAAPSKFFMVDCLGLLNPDKEVQCGQYVSRQGYANDPRASLLMMARSGPASSSSTAVSTKQRYLENNIGMGTSYKAANFPNLYLGAYAGGRDAYNPIFTMEELYFIKAEAYYWMGQKAEACRLAKEATTNNIQRHLEAFKKYYPPTSDDLIKDPTKIYPGAATSAGVGFETELYWNGQVNAFLNNEELLNEKGTSILIPKVSNKGNKIWFFEESTFSLSDLMTQKYIAMYMQPEQWTDMRRYHFSNNRNNYGIGDSQEIVYPTLRRPYNLYAAYWVDGLSESEKENLWLQRINYDPETEEKYNRSELERLGAYRNYKWLQKPMNWANEWGVRSSLTSE